MKEKYSIENFYSFRSFNPNLKILLSSVNKIIHKLFTQEKITLDCDNTLWKGVVGEEGIDGIN